MRKISIKNETGESHDTHIVDIESGKEISSWRRADIHINVLEPVTAEVELVMPKIDIEEAEASFGLTCPHCKEKVYIK